MLADRRAFAVGGDHVVAHVLRMRARVADALDAGHRVEQPQQLAEAAAIGHGQVAAPGVDVLAEQRQLAHALGREALGLGHEHVRGARLLAAAHGRDDAVRAGRVAALRDLQPGLERPLAAHRQVAGELVEGREVPSRHVSPGLDELAEARDVAGAVGQVDERVQLEQLVLDRLRPAAADDDHLGRIAQLGRARVHQAGVEALVGLLADRAGVEDEHVGVLGRGRLAEARATRAAPSCARSRGRSSGSRTW